MSIVKINDKYPFEFETVRVNEWGQIACRKRGRAFAFREPLAVEVGLEMVEIPGGKFMMGSPESEHEHSTDESPQHQVTIQPFYIGKYPVTQAQWNAISNASPVKRELDLDEPGSERYYTPLEDPDWNKVVNLPITGVYWDEAHEFCHRLSRDTGRKYRLPTEAEWEYACRAGTQTPFYFGPTITPDLANYRGTDAGKVDDKCFCSGADDRGAKGIYRDDITPVDTFSPNAFGLYDLHGNVAEWCLDAWHGDYRGAPTDGSAWIADGDDDMVTRGGSFRSSPAQCRSASRQLHTSKRYGRVAIGLRVVCELPRTS